MNTAITTAATWTGFIVWLLAAVCALLWAVDSVRFSRRIRIITAKTQYRWKVLAYRPREDGATRALLIKPPGTDRALLLGGRS